MQVTSGVPQGSQLGLLLFIIFVNDFPLQVTKCEAFGYADDFKLVATNSEDRQYDIKQIEQWCLENKMTLNEYKCYILPIKSQDKPKLNLFNKTLLYHGEQKDLGITMAPKLNWKPNVPKRCSKALKAFYFLKRNTSTSAKLSAKFNAYAGYVVPIVTYATQAWFAKKTETKENERVQKKAIIWILNNWELNYKKRLGKLNLLPLSLYIELHDLLLLISFLSGNTMSIFRSLEIKTVVINQIPDNLS